MQKIQESKVNSYFWPWLPISFGSRLRNQIVTAQEPHCYLPQARPFYTTQRLCPSASSLFSSLLLRLRQFLMTFKS